MVEQAMIFCLGALSMALVGLLALPLLSRRARRRALAEIKRQMPMSMDDIHAERSASRAAYASEIRKVERKAQGLDTRVATAMVEATRQTARAMSLEERQAEDRARIEALAASLQETTRVATDAEATAGAQAVALHEVAALAEQRGEQLASVQQRLTAARVVTEGQRALLADLESQLRTRSAYGDAPAPTAAATTTLVLDEIEAQAAVARLRKAQELMRRDLESITNDRDRLRLRVDELLLRIDELQDQSGEDGDPHSGGPGRRSEPAGADHAPRDEAALRAAITTLAADLVALASRRSPSVDQRSPTGSEAGS